MIIIIKASREMLDIKKLHLYSNYINYGENIKILRI